MIGQASSGKRESLRPLAVAHSTARTERDTTMTDPSAPVSRRRTFAIISHPDAGKTTLTEKLLLFGGAIQLAGEVKAKRNRVSTRSDWMGIERNAASRSSPR